MRNALAFSAFMRLSGILVCRCCAISHYLGHQTVEELHHAPIGSREISDLIIQSFSQLFISLTKSN